MIPRSLKHVYGYIRKKPKWYMRKELVADRMGRDEC